MMKGDEMITGVVSGRKKGQSPWVTSPHVENVGDFVYSASTTIATGA